jgi:hypothetical protein
MAVFALSHLSHWIKHQKEFPKSAADLGMELEPYDVDELLEAPVEQLNSSIRQSTWRRDGADKAKNFDNDGLLQITANNEGIIDGDKNAERSFKDKWMQQMMAKM